MQDAPRIEIVFHAGGGRTARLAEAIAAGAASSGKARIWQLAEDGTAPDGMWAALDAADCIAFGSDPTPGGMTPAMRAMVDGSLMRASWSGKLAAGFAGTVDDDAAGRVLAEVWEVACLHGMTWAASGAVSGMGTLADARTCGERLAQFAGELAAMHRGANVALAA